MCGSLSLQFNNLLNKIKKVEIRLKLLFNSFLLLIKKNNIKKSNLKG